MSLYLTAGRMPLLFPHTKGKVARMNTTLQGNVFGRNVNNTKVGWVVDRMQPIPRNERMLKEVKTTGHTRVLLATFISPKLYWTLTDFTNNKY